MTRRMVRLAFLLAALLPATASAATIETAPDGSLLFRGAEGEANSVEVLEDAEAFRVTDANAAIDIQPDTPCEPQGAGVVCAKAPGQAVVAELGDGDDSARMLGSSTVRLAGGPGNDSLSAGAGADALEGGEGADLLRGGEAADRLEGGEGADTVTYADRREGVRVTPDDNADDGGFGEGDFVAPDVEGSAGGAAGDVLVGGAGGGTTNGGPGPDLIAGGSADDVLLGGSGDDRIGSRDGVAERVSCGDGADFVDNDAGDLVSSDCERRGAGPSGPSAGGNPRPVLGASLVVRRVSGRVRIRRPGRRTVKLLGTQAVPVGTLVDTRDGAVAVTAAATAAGATQTLTARRGRFRLRQARGAAPLTELRLTGGSYRRCRTRARRRAVVRRLSASGRGRFRVRGRYAHATAADGNWRIDDRCDGTRVNVRRGRAIVRAVRGGPSLLVRARQSLLVRARR